MAIGKKTGGGSRKGKPNKVSKDIAEKLADLGCDPIEGMARIAFGAESGFEEKLANLALDGDLSLIPALLKDLSLAGQMYKELAQYVAPKRKAIEHSGSDGGVLELIVTHRQAERMAREFIIDAKSE